MNKISPDENDIKDDVNLGSDFSENKDYDCADWHSVRERKGWTDGNKLRKFKKWWRSI